MPTEKNTIVDEDNAHMMRMGRKGGAPEFWAFKTGPANSPCNQATEALKRAAASLCDELDDLATGAFTVAELATRKAKTAQPFEAAMQKASMVAATERRALAQEMLNFRADPAWSAGTASVQFVFGPKRLDKFLGLREIDRAALCTRIESDPKPYRDLVAALLEAGPWLCGLSAAQLTRMRVAVGRAYRPDEFAVLDVRRDMLETLEQASSSARGATPLAA